MTIWQSNSTCPCCAGPTDNLRAGWGQYVPFMSVWPELFPHWAENVYRERSYRGDRWSYIAEPYWLTEDDMNHLAKVIARHPDHSIVVGMRISRHDPGQTIRVQVLPFAMPDNGLIHLGDYVTAHADGTWRGPLALCDAAPEETR